MTLARIDQFAPTVANGDGVTNSIFFTRDLLRELGYSSEIYSFCIPEELRPDVKPATNFRPADNGLLLYHHSMGHDHGDWLLAQPCAKALIYHNITPAEFFPEHSALRRYAELGRKQLVDWRDAFVDALADSPLNQSELQAAGYQRSTTLALLIDSHRLNGPATMPRFARDLPADADYYLMVGRLAENKRQHLLIEAFYHLCKLRKGADRAEGRLILVGGTTSEDYARGLKHHIHQLGLRGKVLLPGKCSDSELRWLYRNAHQYWCASAHEGFCMPLIEANHAGTAVISCARSNIPETLGEGGLLLCSDAPVDFAFASHLLDEQPGLLKTVLAGGARNLQRYERQRLKQRLANWLAELNPASCDEAIVTHA